MHFSVDNLHHVAMTLLRGMHCNEDEANIVADHLIRANLTGHDSHGVGMLPLYVQFFQAGLVKPGTGPNLETDHGAILVFDGVRGFGQRTIREATTVTLERAKDIGLAAFAVRNAHHIGRVGTYGEQVIAENMIGIFFANVIDHAPFTAPFRGSDARYGTNPMCVAFPATYKDAPLLLDFATSRSAVGKARVALNKGEDMKDGYLLNAQGKPTTDPSVMFQEPRGALIAMGDHKGHGIAMIAEILSSVLSSGNTIQPEHEMQGSIVNNIFGIILDPSKFGDLDAMRREITAYGDYVTASPPQDASAPVLVPGQPEHLSAQERAQNGITIDDTTWQQLLEGADTLGIARKNLDVLTS